MAERKQKIVVDPEMWMARQLHYQERQSGWHIFISIYWSIFVLLVSMLLMFYARLALTIYTFFGLVLFVFAVMTIIYGFTNALHLKLMKRYG
ncbi:MAG: hypothetical protein QW530_01340 [Candidatus Micrarchaeaceae archaeon]